MPALTSLQNITCMHTAVLLQVEADMIGTVVCKRLCSSEVDFWLTHILAKMIEGRRREGRGGEGRGGEGRGGEGRGGEGRGGEGRGGEQSRGERREGREGEVNEFYSLDGCIPAVYQGVPGYRVTSYSDLVFAPVGTSVGHGTGAASGNETTNTVE